MNAHSEKICLAGLGGTDEAAQAVARKLEEDLRKAGFTDAAVLWSNIYDSQENPERLTGRFHLRISP